MALDRTKKEAFLVTHHGKLYDIGPFLSKHPGGIAHLEPYRGRSVTALLRRGHGNDEDAASALVHSEAARYILREFQLENKVLPNQTTKENGIVNGHNNNGYTNGHKLSNGVNGVSQLKTEEPDDFEDLECLVDWSKPMLSQVASLGKNYTKWVNLPVDRSLRLFGHPYLEAVTRSKWYYVPVVWIPVTLMFLSLHFQAGHSKSTAVLGITLGVIAWTLLEYTLHRWFFHLSPGNTRPLITLHFLIHGLHHKVPFDNSRLVFPPVPAGILGVLLYLIYSSLLTDCLLHSMGTGTAMGYIFYDLFHYYLHFGAPSPSTPMYVMKRYHNRHHFSHHDIGYGITSPLWDIVFGTKIQLQKLAKAIKW